MVTISSSHMEGFCFKSIYENEKTVGIYEFNHQPFIINENHLRILRILLPTYK